MRRRGLLNFEIVKIFNTEDTEENVEKRKTMKTANRSCVRSVAFEVIQFVSVSSAHPSTKLSFISFLSVSLRISLCFLR
jgi:ABC-type transport system involved in Fe-S cluster assembly fused permease/ATPase subunit